MGGSLNSMELHRHHTILVLIPLKLLQSTDYILLIISALIHACGHHVIIISFGCDVLSIKTLSHHIYSSTCLQSLHCVTCYLLLANFCLRTIPGWVRLKVEEKSGELLLRQRQTRHLSTYSYSLSKQPPSVLCCCKSSNKYYHQYIKEVSEEKKVTVITNLVTSVEMDLILW